ncbi:MAG: hypothetical protein JO261_05540, partial [Alphaproteobacteria bacterium]|nr:hypothetical protein [Alphaproteobacteria bacterium]
MMKSVASLAVLASAVVMSSAAGAAPNWEGSKPVPMFAVGTDHSALPYKPGQVPPPVVLQTWSGGYTDLTGRSITFKMVGQDPSVSNTDTHIKTVLIPVIFVYGATNGNMTFNPSLKHTSGDGTLSVMKALPQSPMFDPSSDLTSGSIDCGTAQYIDAFQRCTFYGSVQTNTGYHTVLDLIKIKGVKPITINVSAAQGKVINNPFGTGVVGTYPINNFDSTI